MHKFPAVATSLIHLVSTCEGYFITTR